MASQFQSTPAPALYGLYGQRLAQTMGEDPLSHVALIMKANQEAQGYTDALRQSQGIEAAINQDNNQAEMAKTLMTTAAANQKAGIGRGMDIGANPYLSFDPAVATQGDQVGLDTQIAGGVKDRAAAVQDLSNAGHVVSDPTVESYLRGPLASDNYLHFVKDGPSTQEVGMANAAAADKNANAHMISAKTGHGAGDGSVTTVQISDGHGGYEDLSRTIKTKPGAGGGAGAGGGQPDAGGGKVTVYMRPTGQPRQVSQATAENLLASHSASLSPPGK